MMGDRIEESNAVDNQKAITLAMGGIIGALIGLAAAYLVLKNVEKTGEKVDITPGEGIGLGLLVMGLLRQVAKLGNGD
jgi:hypothetical protein